MQFLRHELAVVSGVTEGEFGVFGAFEVEMHIVFPGKADTTVDLDAFARRVAVRIAAIGFAMETARGASGASSSTAQAA